jgi:serine/threonine-protein kinase
MWNPGETFSRFRIEECLGRGGCGEVYRAYDPTLDREVALKILVARDDSGAGGSREVVREARAAAKVRHPNVVTVYEIGQSENAVPFIVMELLRGKPLSDYLSSSRVIPMAKRIRWLLEIAGALGAAHARGLVHRDVKPNNVMICEDGSAKVFDFGIAKRTLRDGDAPVSSQTVAGGVVGTPRYMAPEQRRGENLDGRTDQFAWGLVAYELLSGVSAISADAWFAHDGPERPLAEVANGVPPHVVSAVARALCPTRENRFQTMEDLVLALGDSSSERPMPMESTVGEVSVQGSLDPTVRDAHSDRGLDPGTVIAEKYRIDGRLGEGGMGIVLRAHHLLLDQPVALKILRPEIAARPTAVTRFLNEARAALRIQSPHVGRVIDVGSAATGPFIVLELLDGVDLSRLLEGNGPLPVVTAVDYVLQALEAVAEAHALGIVHRDLKPANLFLARRASGGGMIKVLDFGISKLPLLTPSGAAPDVTLSNTILGSPRYMSPEQVLDAKNVDGRADVWAIGIILYELLTGKVPFSGATGRSLLEEVLSAPIPSPSTLRPDLPPGLEEVILRCLERNVEKRFADALAIAHALAPFGQRDSSRLAVDRIAAVMRATTTQSQVAVPLDVAPRAAAARRWPYVAGTGIAIALAALYGVRHTAGSDAESMPVATTIAAQPVPSAADNAVLPYAPKVRHHEKVDAGPAPTRSAPRTP